MIDHFVHKIAVVADDDDTTGKVGKIFLEYLKCLDIEVVGRFVKHQKVGIFHQHGAEIEFSPFAATQLIHIVVLLFGCEKEMLQQLRGGEVPAAAHVDIVGNVAHHINHLLLVVKCHAFLREIAEAHGLSNVKASVVGLFQSEQHLDKGGFSCAVVAHDAHLLIAGKIVVEILENDIVFTPCLRDILTLEYLAADINIARLEPHLPLFDALFGRFLQFVESLLAVSCLVASGLWHTAHPFQLFAVEVVGTGYFSSCVVDTLLAFFEIIAEIAAIGIDGLVVEFKDEVAYTVEEESVVCHHEQCLVATGKKSLQPLNHVKVEVVGGLVKNEHVGLCNEHIGQGHTPLLSTAELTPGFGEV